MDAREILIANTKTQKRSKITSSASTLGELKAELSAAGVDYSDMTFTEGISKTQLLNDDTQLPQNVMYKGQPTNNLVILLTNTKKNIASGAGDRIAAYTAVKNNNLQDAVKEYFGRNFTQVPTANLWNFIDAHTGAPATPNVENEEEEELGTAPEVCCYDEEEPEDFGEEDTSVLDSIYTLIDSLASVGTLNAENIRELADDLYDLAGAVEDTQRKPLKPVSTSDGSITDEDIDDMIRSMK